jgi:hypothetical protein
MKDEKIIYRRPQFSQLVPNLTATSNINKNIDNNAFLLNKLARKIIKISGSRQKEM